MKKLLCFIFISFIFNSLDAAYISVYSSNINGALSWTGNTLGLNCAQGQNEPGTSGSIGAFITTDLTQQVGSFPPGTTLDWTLSRSAAVLDIPPGSTILHAELIWSGSYGFDPSVSGPVLDTPILFISPDGNSHSITPNPGTSQSVLNGFNTGFYVRSSDVTSIVSSQGGGTYTVGGVPGTIIPNESDLNCSGWTLAVAYSNPKMLTSNLTLFVACEPPGTSPVLVNGFQAPATGTVSSRLFVSALEGDVQFAGDHFLVGATSTLTYPANALSGSNNLKNNFFASQINTLLPLQTNSDGKLVSTGSSLLDTRGTFGFVNSNINSPQGFPAARQGYDITSIDLGNIIVNGQSQLYAQGTTSGDVYVINVLGIQIQVAAPLIVGTLQGLPEIVQNNLMVEYTATFTNTGQTTANSVTFYDNLPLGLTFDPTSFKVNGSPVANPNINSGVPLGDLPINQTFTITYEASVTQINPPNTYSNQASVTYSYTPASSSEPIDLTSTTNIVTISAPTLTPPQANPDTGTTNINTPYNGPTVLNNDTGDGISVSSYDPTTAQGGSVVMQQDGTFVYYPPTNFSGFDTFNYTIKDPVGQTSSSTVTIKVLPQAIGNVAIVAANTTLNQTTSVLNNDLGVGLTVSSYTAASLQGGVVSMLPNGTYTYTPAVDFSGIDIFHYTITDTAGSTSTTIVTITVLPPAANDLGTTSANIPLDGSTSFNPSGGDTITTYDHSSSQGGQVTLDTSTGTYVYVPPTNFSGTDTFTYTTEAPGGFISQSTVTITVLPIAQDDSITTTVDTPITNPTNVLSNDAGSGLVVSNPGIIETIKGGTVTLQSDGNYAYTPPLNFSGTDSFTYTGQDNQGNPINATVAINVLPKAINDSGSTSVNTPLKGASLLSNDLGTGLSIVSHTQPTSGGQVSVNNQAGTYTYTPPAAFTGIDQFSYTAVDSSGSLTTATVTINVEGAAGAAPLPPTGFYGSLRKCSFLNKNTYHLEISWDPSPSPNIVLYRIYASGRVIAEVPANTTTYQECIKTKKLAGTYQISAIDNTGLESSLLQIRI